MKKESSSDESHTTLIGSIAGCGVGALAITGVFFNSTSVAITIVVATSVGVAAVLRQKGQKQRLVSKLENRILEMESRLEAVETIERFEDRLADKKAKLTLSYSESKSETDSV